MVVRMPRRNTRRRPRSTRLWWIWCTTDEGESRWVPENWIEKEGEQCVLLRPYTATELSVEEGETVTVEFEESSWGWATNESGQNGWVPLECLEGLA